MAIAMLTHVEFRSEKFPPFEGEEELINPDLWGRRLADFLREGLTRQGFELSEPGYEDWGCYIQVLNQPIKMWIGCGHYQDLRNPESDEDSYLCFIEPHKPRVWSGVRRVDTRAHIERLQQAMDKVLSEESSIREKRWWSFEDFNEPEDAEPEDAVVAE